MFALSPSLVLPDEIISAVCSLVVAECAVDAEGVAEVSNYRRIIVLRRRTDNVMRSPTAVTGNQVFLQSNHQSRPDE